EDVDYRTPRRLDKALFQQLATCRWIAEHRGLLISGPCGVGKSWLSCALAQKACRDGYTVHYARVPRLFADLDLPTVTAASRDYSACWSRSGSKATSRAKGSHRKLGDLGSDRNGGPSDRFAVTHPRWEPYAGCAADAHGRGFAMNN